MKSCASCVVWVAAVVGFQVLSTRAVNPGFRTILTQRGLDYAKQVGLSVLKEKLCKYKIPSISESTMWKIVTVNYTFSNLAIKNLNFGHPSLTSDLRGVVLTDDGISLSVSSDWSFIEDDWPHLMDNGSVNVSAHGISFSVRVNVTFNKTNGHFGINITDCSFGLDRLHLIFSGGASFMYNLFGPAIEDDLKTFLKKKTCPYVGKWINTWGNNYVQSLPVVMKVGDGVEISYALVSDANFTHKGRIVTDHKGEFLLTNSPYHPPFNPPPLPDPSADHFNESKMIYVIATKYVAESASYSFWKAGLMAYNVSNEKISPEFSTTCTPFYSAVVPPLCSKFGKKKVMFGIAASDYPRLNMTEKYASMQAALHASMYVDNNGSMELAFTLNVGIQADVKPKLKFDGERQQYIIYGNISNPKIGNISLADSNIGHFDCTPLKVLITSFAPDGLRYLNKYTHRGFPIPMIHGFSFTEPMLYLGEGYVVVGSNVHYKEETTCNYN